MHLTFFYYSFKLVIILLTFFRILLFWLRFGNGLPSSIYIDNVSNIAASDDYSCNSYGTYLSIESKYDAFAFAPNTAESTFFNHGSTLPELQVVVELTFWSYFYIYLFISKHPIAEFQNQLYLLSWWNLTAVAFNTQDEINAISESTDHKFLFGKLHFARQLFLLTSKSLFEIVMTNLEVYFYLNLF